MKNYILLFIVSQLAFSQSNKENLEEKIYNATETFSANANPESLKIVEQKEKTFQPKTKAEFLAMVYLLCNKAYYLKNNNQSKKAISSYEKAWQIHQKETPKESLKTYDILEFCLKPLGNLYTTIGDYDNAENVIKNYFYIANLENNKPHKFSAILNLTNVYYYSGKNQEAINLLEKTLQTEKLSDAQKGMLWNSLGNNYLHIEKSEKAGKCYGISIQLLKNTDEKSSLSNSYRNTALINNDIKTFEKAKELFFQDKTNSPRQIAKLYLDEAVLFFQNNKIEEAQNDLVKVYKTLLPNYSQSKIVLPNQNSLYAENTFIDALDLQATLFTLNNQPKKALESYALSFYVDELLQSLLVFENSKIVNQINSRNRTEKCIAIYYNLYQKEKKTAYLEDAFLLQEKSKSAVLKSYATNKKTQSREEKIIVEQLQNWNTIIIKEQQKLDYADISKINEAIKKQNELMLLLKSKQLEKSDYFVPRNDNSSNLKNLYTKLEKDNAVLVEYFAGENNYYCFTIQDKKITINKIENSSKDSLIYQFITLFKDSETISNNPTNYIQIANNCYKTLKLPKPQANKNLILVPDGILTFLPFEALVTKNTATTNFSKINYLLNDFAISYSNSAQFYSEQVSFQFEKENVLGIFPVFKNSNLELTFSVNEMKAIEKQFSGNYLQKNNATFSNFKQNALTYSILHLSTHASSGDVFEPATIKFIDEDVLYSEFYNLNIHPNLVVLSACETGLGKLYKSEGAMSIARGFQFAGAQNLLFSLWKVNDFTTSVFMEDFYKNIKNGKSYSEANHDAKLSFLKDSTIPNAKKSPYYWSAFVYYGTLENNHSATNYWFWVSLIGSMIIIALVYLFLSFRRRRNHIK